MILIAFSLQAVTYSAIIYCLRCLIKYDIPLNHGCLAPIQVIFPENSIISPSENAAVVGGLLIVLVFHIFKQNFNYRQCVNIATNYRCDFQGNVIVVSIWSCILFVLSCRHLSVVLHPKVAWTILPGVMNLMVTTKLWLEELVLRLSQMADRQFTLTWLIQGKQL